MNNIIGIDPGFTGAVAILDNKGRLADIWDTPTFQIKGGKKNKTQFDVRGMATMIEQLLPCTALLESVHSMPEQGIVGAFAFGRGLGIWEGILAAFAVPTEMIPPQRWKKAMMGGMGKEKDASRMKALQLYPKAPLALKKHHNRADALLMATYLYRQGKNKCVRET